jgi:hypothetical protein
MARQSRKVKTRWVKPKRKKRKPTPKQLRKKRMDEYWQDAGSRLEEELSRAVSKTFKVRRIKT